MPSIFRGVLKQIEYSVRAENALIQEFGPMNEILVQYVKPTELRLFISSDLTIELVVDQFRVITQTKPKRFDILLSPVE
jgi:hypothetical protein